MRDYMSSKKEINMKYFFFLILLTLSFNLQAQDWVGDKDYKKKIHEKIPLWR